MQLKAWNASFWVGMVVSVITAGIGWHSAESAVTDPTMSEACTFDFPSDHGAHPDYQTEWWYYTGNLSTPEGEAFGFQMTLFRTRIIPSGGEPSWPRPASPWRTSQLYIGHAAISHINQKRHYHDQIMARAANGLAGSESVSPDRIRIYLKNWSVEMAPGGHQIRVDTNDFKIKLRLLPDKPWVAHGRNGYSPKGFRPESASCYYSFTRLKTQGTIEQNAKTYRVSGLSWMDREYFNASLEAGTVGWDWFSLQLSDRSEIMLYLLRQKDGTVHPVSQGTYVNSDGVARSLSLNEISVTALDFWESSDDSASYPSKWQVVIAPLDLNLEVETRIPDQLMLTQETTGIDYYEGSVRTTGSKASTPVEGLGYVELTGYSDHLGTGQIW